jgi:hypothetical protein
MNLRRLWAILALCSLPAVLSAQDARSFALGGSATALPMDIFGLYLNPADLAWPSATKSGWTVASGFSAFDSSNTDGPILQFNNQNAMASTQDPIIQAQQYLGIFGVRFQSFGGGVLYDQQLNYTASQGALAFLNARNNGPIAPGSTYNFNYLQTNQQIADLILSYATPLPLGATQFFSVGGSLKYHDGLQYQQTSLMGTYTQGSSTGYTYTKTTSNTGWGLSIDAGFLLKFTDAIQMGMLFQNLSSNFSWQAQQQTFTLDPVTGADILGASSSVTVQAPFPYATNLGLVIAPSGKNISLTGEVNWSQQRTHWSFGLEKVYPENGIVARFGTFYDYVSQSNLWSFGFGYIKSDLNIDVSFATRNLPSIEDSIALGGAVDVLIRF